MGLVRAHHGDEAVQVLVAGKVGVERRSLGEQDETVILVGDGAQAGILDEDAGVDARPGRERG